MPDETNKVIREELRGRLKIILSRASDMAVEALLQSVMEPATPPSDPMISQLLSEKCSPNEIHLALAYCRNALLMLQMRVSEDRDFTSMTRLLAHHDRMTSLLLQAIEKQYEQARELLQTEFLKEGQAHLLNRAVTQWSQKNKVTLYNYYKEIPVSVSIKLLHSEEDSFIIENRQSRLAAVFSASSDGRSAYIRLPESELSVQILVQETTQTTLHCRYGDFLPLNREKRGDTRVQSSTPVHISLKGSEQEAWEGSVMDISASGLGISCKCASPFHVGDILTFSMVLQGEWIAGKGVVCWVRGSKGYYRAGLAIEYKQDIHLLLGNEVLRREKNLMGELKLKGIPDCLLEN
ncbi:MAG: PilZ domain-containing protein [Mariprofundaceae bacterium]|nr:PilZ domain-containing protein [Mariprofundaceae bacterium]